MRSPIRVFSDLHLGHPASLITEVEQLRPLIAGAGTVIFNGDTWQELAGALQGESARLLSVLQELCIQEGAEALFLPGNHDPSIGETQFLELDHGRIVIMHGQIIYPEVSPWSNYYLDAEPEVQALIQQRLTPQITIAQRFALAREVVTLMTPKRWIPRRSRWRYYLGIFWPPRRLMTLLRIKRAAPLHALQFCQQHFPKGEVFIIGHFHQLMHVQRNGATLYNTGAFMSGCKMQFLEIEEGKVTARKIHYDNNDKCFVTSGEKIH